MKRILKILVMLIKILSIITPLGLLAQNLPEDYLEIHNHARASVGVGELKWEINLQVDARNFVYKHKGDCLKAGPGAHFSVGQNNARKLGSLNLTGVDAVRTWVAQKKHYAYRSNCCVSGECRAYKQVVWKTTTHVGCARIICHNDVGVLITCVYEPPGNIPAIRPY